MLLLVGLGNPGPDHARDRHNIGFMAADRIAEDWGFGPWRRRFQADTAEGRLDGKKTLLLKPTTFMNESGRAVGEAVRGGPWPSRWKLRRLASRVLRSMSAVTGRGRDQQIVRRLE